MFTFPVVLLFVCTISSVWMATPYKDCGSEAGTVQSFDVTGCTAAPCKFIKGHNYTMSLTTQAKAPSKTATIKMYGIIGGIPIPFPGSDPNACNLGEKCPVSANDVNSVSLTLPILSSYPSLSLYVKIELVADDLKQDYGCLQFPVTISG